eukprot:4179006-Prymnesium_polylepis.1
MMYGSEICWRVLATSHVTTVFFSSASRHGTGKPLHLEYDACTCAFFAQSASREGMSASITCDEATTRPTDCR